MFRVPAHAVRRFRLARLGLTEGHAHPDPVTAVRRNVGIQSQVEALSLLGLSLRTAGHPDATRLARTLHDDRAMVRTWGPRDTLHLFDLATWPHVVAARSQWGKSARAAVPVDPEVTGRARARVQGARQPLTREDLRDLVPQAWLDGFEHPYFDTERKKWQFATGRMIWQESNAGRLAHGPKRGSEQSYVPRHIGWPALAFDHADDPPARAAAHLARRYLAAYGPATVQDLAHFFGAKVGSARTWVADLRPHLVEVEVEGRTLLLLADDADALRDAVDAPSAGVRLLPGYDGLLMGHADKSWTVREPSEAKAVWRSAARVSAVALDDGVIVATWTHKARAREVDVEVTPLSGWRPALAEAVEAEAHRVAQHLGRDHATLAVG